MNWKDFKKEYLGKDNAEFGVEFAWSCHSCLIEGYPDGRECVTLAKACRRFKVGVVIDAEESGIGFEEHVECGKDGNLMEECMDMPVYICDCGEERIFPTNCGYLDDEECFECGKFGKWRLRKEGMK